MAWSRRPSARLRMRDRVVTDPDHLAHALDRFLEDAFHRRRGDEDRPPQGGALAARLRRRRHGLDGRGRYERPCRVLHPVALLGVRLRLRAAGNRRADAEPRRELFAAKPARSIIWRPAGCRSTRSIRRSRCSRTAASWPMAAWAATASRRRKARCSRATSLSASRSPTRIDRPRWVLGRTWGAARTALRLEARFDGNLIDALAAAGHDVEVLAGALFRRHGPRRRGGAAPGRHLRRRPRSARRRRRGGGGSQPGFLIAPTKISDASSPPRGRRLRSV